jgi:hypothetical protein
LKGSVFWDRNVNDIVDSGEELAGARLAVREKKNPGHVIETRTTDNGTYIISIPQLTEFSVELSATGCNATTEPITTGVDPVSRDFKIVPFPALVDMFLEAGGSPVPSGVKVNITTFTDGSKGGEFLTDARGHISSYFMPGWYAAAVSQNISTSVGAVNLSLTQAFNVSIGQSAMVQNFSLERKYYLSGTVFFDENGDGIPQRAEYRNSLVKFVPESATGNVEAAIPGIPSLSTVVSLNTVEGRYDVGLAPGNYTVWSLIELPTPGGPPQVFIAHVAVDQSITLNISLEQGCKVRGLAYADLNANGLYETGEQRSGVPVAFSEAGTVLLTVGSDPSGYFELTLPQGGSFGLAVNNSTMETLSDQQLVPIRYLASAGLDVPLSSAMQPNLTMLRQVDTYGRVSYDKNADGGPGAGEGVPGIAVVFTAPGGNRTVAVTNSTGDFDIYLESRLYNMSVEAPGFNSSIPGLKSADVSLERRNFNFSLDALNATLSLEVGLDGKPAKIPGGAVVTLQALDGRAANASGRTDPGGVLGLALRPGIYSLYVTGVRDGVRYAYLAPLDIEPSGAAVPAVAELLAATRLWGSASMVSGLEGRAAPDSVDLVLNTTMNVSGRIFSATLNFTGQDPVYQLYVPAANYSLAASFVRKEAGQNITYNTTARADIGAGAQDFHMDLVLTKVMDRALGLSWDKAQKVTVQPNSTANYTLQLTNLGNNRTTVNLEVSKPGGWSVDVGIDKVTLEIG